MFITWHGHSCFKLTGKSNGEDIVVVIDPYNNEIGLRPVKGEANIVLLNSRHRAELDPSSLTPGYFLIDEPGEYEVKKVYVEGIMGYCDKVGGKENGLTTLYHVKFEDINIVHLGYLGTVLTNDQVQKLESCDILLLPVGNNMLSVKDAMAVISQVQPYVVIPMMYKIPNLTYDCSPISAFLKEVGMKESDAVGKYKITKKDLVSEDTSFILLEKS